MLKKAITFTDYNGERVTEDHYFNLSKAELLEQEILVTKTDSEGNRISETFRETLQKIIDSNDGAQILPQFKKIVRWAYGKRSEDGRRFMKSEAISDDFISSPAYDELFMEFLTDTEAASAFINAIVPPDFDINKEMSASEKARARSEAGLQGYKKPEEKVETVTEPASAPTLSTSERIELEELRALKAAQSVGHEFSKPADNNSLRPPHETGPGFQQQ